MTLPAVSAPRIGIAERGKMVLTPKLVIDRSEFANADDEYTPAQRRIIDARLAKSDEDIRHGRVLGPVDTAEEMAASIEANIGGCGRRRRKTKPAR